MKNNKSYNNGNNGDQYYDLEKINNAIFGENRREFSNHGLNEETDKESDDIEEIEIKGQNIISDKSNIKKKENQKSSLTQNEKQEKIQKFKNEN